MPRLSREAKAYRIGHFDNAFPIWSGVGAALYPQRWNARGQQAIYAAEHYATAMLEVLARQSRPSQLQKYIEITFPKSLSYECIDPDKLTDWRQVGSRTAQLFGRDWIAEQRSAILYVPSVIADVERNVVINPMHPEFDKISVSDPHAVRWDDRLFK